MDLTYKFSLFWALLLTNFFLTTPHPARADTEVSVGISTRVLTQSKGQTASTGRLIVEVTNQSNKSLSNVVIRLAEPTHNRIGNGSILLGNMLPKQVKVVDVDYFFTDEGRNLRWLASYKNAKGAKFNAKTVTYTIE